MNSEIVIVSGLPRSGTSLMMQMLHNGGIEAVTDNIRTADTDNPKGYYEFEQVKKIKQDASWLPQTRGKVFKMVSQLLYDLPSSESYRIVFMDRDLDETLSSQEKMLARLGGKSAPREPMKQAYKTHLERLHDWLSHQDNMKLLRVSYNELLEQPATWSDRICQFLEGRTNRDRMVRTVDPSLYRNRKTSRQSAG
jgi:hypothetical protein